MPLLSSRIGTVAVGVIAIAATVAILLTGAATINGRDSSSSTPDFVLETPDTVPDFDTAGDTNAVPEDLPFEEPAGTPSSDTKTTPKTQSDTSVRRVAPDEFSSKVESRPLERIEPRPQLSEAEPREEKPATSVLSQPVPISAGEISFGQGTVQLDGLTAADIDRTCTGTNGRAWPCGMMARTALRSFIRGRALTCSVPDAGFTGKVTAKCALGSRDVGQWLVENGWAEANPGSPLEKAGADARAQKRGLFGNDPRGVAETAPIDDIEFQ